MVPDTCRKESSTPSLTYSHKSHADDQRRPRGAAWQPGLGERTPYGHDKLGLTKWISDTQRAILVLKSKVRPTFLRMRACLACWQAFLSAALHSTGANTRLAADNGRHKEHENRVRGSTISAASHNAADVNHTDSLQLLDNGWFGFFWPKSCGHTSTVHPHSDSRGAGIVNQAHIGTFGSI